MREAVRAGPGVLLGRVSDAGPGQRAESALSIDTQAAPGVGNHHASQRGVAVAHAAGEPAQVHRRVTAVAQDTRVRVQEFVI